jgi:transcriptional regulator with XRE-family HTH domain
MRRKMKSTVTGIRTALSAKTKWNGHVLECELRKPGGMLMGALMSHATDRGETLQELAEHLDVTYGYLGQLRSGARKVRTISGEFARDSAKYLGVSLTRVLLMCGQLTPVDFYESHDVFTESLAAAMAHIGRDARWGHLLTQELRAANQATQYVVVRLYQEATSTMLMPQCSEFVDGNEKLAA